MITIKNKANNAFCHEFDSWFDNATTETGERAMEHLLDSLAAFFPVYAALLCENWKFYICYLKLPHWLPASKQLLNYENYKKKNYELSIYVLNFLKFMPHY